MKYIIKTISLILIILTLLQNLAGQNSTNTTTPSNTTSNTNLTDSSNSTNSTSSTNTTTPTNNTTSNGTLSINNTSSNGTTPVIPTPPVKVETDPYKIYLCDQNYINGIGIVNIFYTIKIYI